MTKPLLLTKAQVERVIRAAKKEGAKSILVNPDGSVRIDLTGEMESGAAKSVWDAPQ